MANRLLVLTLTLAGILVSGAVMAHFNLNLNVRILHVEHLADGHIRGPSHAGVSE